MNNVTNWVFDLDNTLYKAECGLFDKVHVLMGRYIEEKLGLASGEAQALRSKYYHGWKCYLSWRVQSIILCLCAFRQCQWRMEILNADE
jgi:FMN phosphatase YigB (HAD superfamily)